jgi:hypothetical protein
MRLSFQLDFVVEQSWLSFNFVVKNGRIFRFEGITEHLRRYRLHLVLSVFELRKSLILYYVIEF